MFVVDNTVFIHLQKSAGTSIFEMLIKERRNDIKFLINHKSLRSLPEEYESYRKIALVRNPLTWYESFYNYLIFNRDNHPKVYESFPYIEKKLIEDKRISFFLQKALNFDYYFNPRKTELSKNLIEHQRPMMSDFYPNALNIHFEKTFYQDRVEILGIRECELFHMETQFDEVMDILKLKNKLFENKIEKTERLSVSQQQQILEVDETLFDLFGYKKEII
jgi:hypothetical protein